MRKAMTLVILLFASAPVFPDDGIMETDLNPFRNGARISGVPGQIIESVRFGDLRDSVLRKVHRDSIDDSFRDDGFWRISFYAGGDPLAYLNWTGVNGKPKPVNATLVGSEESGLVELDYFFSIGDHDEPRQYLYRRSIELYAWIVSIIGEPIENPANLVKPDTLSAIWITSDDVIVHLESQGKPFVHVKIVTPFGPSRAEVEAWGRAHAAQFAKDEFERIRIGMTLDEVVQEAGSIGELQSEELVGGEVLRTFKWTNGDGSTASVVFNQDDIAVRKTQDGLK